MNPYELVALITAVGIFIAEEVTDDNELNVLSCAFTQLGDTLATIAAQRIRFVPADEGESPPAVVVP